MKKQIGYTLLVLVLLGALVGYWLYAKTTPDVVQTTPDVVITADALTGAFAQDAAAARRRFNGKVILVTGRVKSISPSGAVVLESSTGASEVVVGLDERHKQDLANLRTGADASLQGVYSGYEKSSGDAGDLLSSLGATVHLRSAGLKAKQ